MKKPLVDRIGFELTYGSGPDWMKSTLSLKYQYND